MSQINVNQPPTGSGDSGTTATTNLVAVILVLAVLLLVGWWLFTAGPLGTGSVNVNVNPAGTAQPARPTAAPAQATPAPVQPTAAPAPPKP